MIALAAALRAVLGVLDELEIPYVVAGSTAAAAWGVVRTTRDVDVVIAIDGDQAGRALDLLERAGLYIPAEEARRALSSAGSFNALHRGSGGKVDIFVVDPLDGFTRTRLERRQRVEVLGVPAWIDAPEGVLLAKLWWRRDSRSEVQWRDCAELAAATALDLDYLRTWAGPLGVSADLEELLAAVDEA